jgi:hypothetical protein
VELHLVPGFFGDAPLRLLEALRSGYPFAAAEGGPLAIPGGDPGPREERCDLLSARVGLGPPLPLRLRRYRLLDGRLLVGLEAVLEDPGLGTTGKDLEIAALGLGCAALARDSQGALLVGEDLGVLGAGLARQGLPDQVRELVSLHGPSLALLVLAPDTARGLSELPGFGIERLGDLVLARRPR